MQRKARAWPCAHAFVRVLEASRIQKIGFAEGSLNGNHAGWRTVTSGEDPQDDGSSSLHPPTRRGDVDSVASMCFCWWC
eukprot:362835-Chlamydomonas_euryale.AAC.6